MIRPPQFPLLAVLLFAIGSVGVTAELLDRPVGWRTDASGAYLDANPPAKWSSTENIRWKVAMPGRSYGSPIVIGQRLIVVSDPAELICLDAGSGEQLWRKTYSAAEAVGAEAAAKLIAESATLNDRRQKLQREFGDLRKAKPDAKEEHEALQAQMKAVEQQLSDLKLKNPIHSDRGSGNTAATPICDGQLVYAVFGSGIVAACTLEGETRWVKFIEGSDIGFGHSSSPVLVGGKLIVHFHDLVALDPATGNVQWRTPLSASHATPIAVRIGQDPAVATPSGSVVRASDGKVLLTEPALRVSEGSPVATESVLFAQGDKTSAFKLPTTSVEKLELLWQTTASRGRRTPSPVVHEGLIYGVTTEGILDVTDAETGEIAYRKRLDLEGDLYSSVTAAGDHIYLSSTRGQTLVLAAGDKYEEIARNELESWGACPVFVGDRLYFRGHKNLYCIGP
ncbi:MAG: PQQ-binding-like beta-propeller repeat protein [Pirellulaceae bacterium]|nr:PQQ-binding-like beta-propeller repeat protein [Pirellulaceae bacterium]